MFVDVFHLPKIAHTSYLVGATTRCAVVDPQRHVELYLEAAQAKGVAISHVLLTHLHADFVAGHLELVERTGATVVAPRAAQCTFPHVGVSPKDTFELEHLSFEVLATPGHTPEHVSYVVTDLSRGTTPVAVFCGDTLFVNDVGRPDLFPGRAQELASLLFDSVGELLSLPDSCELYPAHGPGSLCGKSIGAKLSSTIGYERRHNAALRPQRHEFVDALLRDMPPAPDHFARCSEVNRRGPALLSSLEAPRALPVQDFSSLLNAGALVLDVREYESFSGLHVPGSLCIPLSSNFPLLAGWLVPPSVDLLLVAPPGAHTQAVRWLQAVGLDRVVGFLEPGVAAWASAGQPVASLPLVSSHSLDDSLPHALVVDVRSTEETRRDPLPVPHVTVPLHLVREASFPNDKVILTVCGSGQRAAVAASLLLRRGLRAACLAGGLAALRASRIR